MTNQNLNIFGVTNLSDPELYVNYQWWSQRTIEQKSMLDRTPEWFANNLIFAVFALNADHQLIGAAGLFPARDQNNVIIEHFDGRIVVELGSLYVSPEYERRGIARRCVEERLKHVKAYNFFPVMVTRDPTMTQRILNGSASPIENYLHLQEVGSKIRYCACREEKKDHKATCEFCPKIGKTVLVFKEFL